MTEHDTVHPEAARRWGGWSWRQPSRGEHFRRCSYCGSIHPADLAAEPAWRAEWADMKYGWPHKFYVDIPNRDPGALFVVSTQSGGNRDHPGNGMLDWYAWGDLTPEQIAIVERDGCGPRGDYPPPDFVGFGKRPNHFGKFYTIHLADPAIDAAVKGAIERKSGLSFTFADGRVAWAETLVTEFIYPVEVVE